MSSMLRTSRVIVVGLLGLGACANGVVDDLAYETDPNAQAGTTSGSGSGGGLGSGGTTGLGGSLGTGGSVAGSAGSSSPFGGSAGVTSGGGAGMAGSAGTGGSSGAFGAGGSSGAFGNGGSAGKGSGGSGGTGANCTGLPTYPATPTAVMFEVGDEIQHKGIRYKVVATETIVWANAECAPDIAAVWCDDDPMSGQWWEVVGPC